MQYQNLLSSFNLNNKIELKNRVIMAAMNTNFANEDGSISKKYSDYFLERAKGEVAMIIIAPGYVDRKSRKRLGSLLLDDEKYIAKLKEFTDSLHKYECKVLQQLNHNGRLLTSSNEFKTAGGSCIGPSAVPHALTGEIPKVMNKEDIKRIVDLFAINAKNAKLAGYDGVEIHGAHGYLINQFLSNYSNKREDEYGGTIENRMRFPIDIIKAVKEEVGKDFVISFRLEAEEFNPGGVEIEEAIILAKKLEEEGIDLLNVSVGNTETPRTALKMFPPTSEPQGCYENYSKEIKKHVNIPVSIMGRITTPECAEEILNNNSSDLVTIGRGLICDPHFVKKTAENRRNELRQCIGCLQGCYEELAKEKPMTCIYNSFVGKEGEKIEKSSEIKNIWIIGGGPAGLEASRVAAERGHNVELFEAEDKLGGQINIASIPPGKEEYKEIIKYYENELFRLNVKVHLNKKIKLKDINENRPDILILSTGSEPLILSLPGLKQQNVLTAKDVLKGARIGNKVLVCGGGLVGIETALHLSETISDITIIEMIDKILCDTGPLNRERLMQEIKEKNIKILTKHKLKAIEGKYVIIETPDGTKKIEADTVVLALGLVSNKELENDIKDKDSIEYYSIGDCVKARKILEAVAEGAEIGLKI